MHSGFCTTVSCHKRDVLTVGSKWFLAEDVVSTDGVREVLLVSRNPRSAFALHGKFLGEGVRFEILPDVFVTVKDASKRSKVKLLIEAPRGVPIARGYPRELKSA